VFGLVAWWLGALVPGGLGGLLPWWPSFVFGFVIGLVSWCRQAITPPSHQATNPPKHTNTHIFVFGGLVTWLLLLLLLLLLVLFLVVCFFVVVISLVVVVGVGVVVYDKSPHVREVVAWWLGGLGGLLAWWPAARPPGQ
jgi:hypothetical protein